METELDQDKEPNDERFIQWNYQVILDQVENDTILLLSSSPFCHSRAGGNQDKLQWGSDSRIRENDKEENYFLIFLLN